MLKNRFAFYKQNLHFFFSSKHFQYLLIFMIIIAMYGTFVLTIWNNSRLKYFDAYLAIFNNRTFILFLLILSLLTTVIVNQNTIHNEFYAIRFHHKKIFLKEYIIQIVLINIILYFMLLIIILIGLNIFCSHGLGIHEMYPYNINNVVYSSFFTIKNAIILLCIAVMNGLVLTLFSRIFVIIINCIYYVSIFFASPTLILGELKLNLIDNLTIQSYSSFFNDIFFSILYILLLIFAIFIMKIICEEHMRQV